MLEVLGIRLTEAHIGVMQEGFPTELKVDLSVDRVTKHDDGSITLEFTYNIQYMPGLAVVNVRGVAFCRDNPENIKKVLDAWRNKKELPTEIAGPAINMINANVGVNSLFLLRPFELSPHFMPPPIFVSKGGAPPAKGTMKKGAKKSRKKK